MRAEVELAEGYRLELWAQGPGSLRIADGAATLWQAPALAAHPDFFAYQHREGGRVAVEWDRPEAILWAYGYDPATVAETGITVWEFGADGLALRTGREIDAWMRADPDRPALHLSPIRQWMNDPNGLCHADGRWHVFYQFHPAGPDWGPMHWGHATSRNLVDWTHLPVFLHPEQNLWRLGATGGAFSGSAVRDRDGRLLIFHTERLPAYDLVAGYREVQRRVRPGRDLVRPVGAETVIAAGPRAAGVEHDFRDPKVWWDEGAGAWRMVLGAALHGDPAVLLYGSDDLTAWTYLGPLYRAPPHYRENGARAVECPDLFPLDGRWVMVMGFVGYTEPGTGRHNLLVALVGDFREDRFVPDGDAPQILDFGTDFYAMQSVGAEGRRLALAWVFNWEDRKPAGSPYSGEMSLPRELSLDGRGRLRMAPVAELDAARPARALAATAPGAYAPEGRPVDLRLSGALEGSRITATQAGALSWEVTVTGGRLAVRLPRDDGRIRYEADVHGATDLRLIHDRGILEVFADRGAVCGTRRSYANGAPDRIEIASPARVDAATRDADPPR